MADPTVIHVDSDGNPISIPTQIARPTQPLTTHIDTDGNVIGLNGKLLQGPPPGQGPDIGENLPSGNTLGTSFARSLPGIGATAATALIPEAPVASGIAGAGAGTAVANILKSFAPKYFAQNGETPTMQKQLTDIGTNAGLEGTGQLVAAAAPEGSRLALAALGKVKPFSSGVAQLVHQSNVDDLMAAANQNTEQGKAISSVLRKGMKGGAIKDTDDIRTALDDFVNDPTQSKSLITDVYGNKKIRDVIPQDVQANIRAILDQTDKLKESSGGGDSSSFMNYKNGKYVLKYGLGMAANAALGMGHPYLAGTVALGGIQLSQATLSKIAQSPGLTKAMIGAMNPATPAALGKLYQQGLLNGLRGEEVYFQHPDGTTEKAKINEQGVPQLSQ